MYADANSLGTLAALMPQGVSRYLGKPELVAAELHPSPGMIAMGEEALRAVKTPGSSQLRSLARLQAERVGALGDSLNERFNAYVGAWSALQKYMEELREIGFPTDGFESALARAGRQTTFQLEEDGAIVPDYLGATALLQASCDEARWTLLAAKEGSHEIFLATLAVEALMGPRFGKGSAATLARLEPAVERASRELALGHVTVATELASEVRRQADEALARLATAPDVEAHAATGEPAAVRGDTGDEPTNAPEPSLSARGPSDSCGEVSAKPVPMLEFLQRAEKVQSQFKERGLSSSEADEALQRAQEAFVRADWAEVRRGVARVARALARMRKARAALAKRISDRGQRVALLKESSFPFLLEARDAILRAKEEFEAGRFSDADDYLVCADDLLLKGAPTGPCSS